MRPVIGHTIFFTSEKKWYRFSRLSARLPKVGMFTTFSASPDSIKVSRFADIVSVEQFIKDQENENTKKKTECCFAYGISDAEERVKTYERNSLKGAECIHQRTYHYGTKEK